MRVTIFVPVTLCNYYVMYLYIPVIIDQTFVIFQMICCQTSAPPQASPVTNDNAEEYTADEGMNK